MDEFVLVLTACASRAEGEVIGKTLVEEALAACVHILPAGISIYRWRGKLERAEEHTLLIKSVSSARDRLRRRIRELHSYEVPEILILPVAGGDPDYLSWVSESVTS